MDKQPTRVLVIDDNPDIRKTIQWLLEDEGFVVAVAENGREGLGLQRRQPADVVVTDIFMPEQDGIETIWQLREEFPQVPIIVISGGGAAGKTDYMVVAHELGARKTLRKPVNPQELIDIVRQISRSSYS
jgi:DNA-binding response OmpR family regulator